MHSLTPKEGRTFKLMDKKIYYPWKEKHDGAGVFLLQNQMINF